MLAQKKPPSSEETPKSLQSLRENWKTPFNFHSSAAAIDFSPAETTTTTTTMIHLHCLTTAELPNDGRLLLFWNWRRRRRIIGDRKGIHPRNKIDFLVLCSVLLDLYLRIVIFRPQLFRWFLHAILRIVFLVSSDSSASCRCRNPLKQKLRGICFTKSRRLKTSIKQYLARWNVCCIDCDFGILDFSPKILAVFSFVTVQDGWKLNSASSAN